MRIAYVINSVEGGGAALPVPAVARVLQGCGAEVEIYALTRRDGRAIAAMEAAGLHVHVRAGGEKDHLEAFRWLEARMAQARPDLIWTSLTRATLLGQQVGRRLRIPVVSWQHAAFLKPANRILLRAFQHLSALWIADSHSVAALTRQRLAVPSERLTTWALFAAEPDAPQATPWRPGETLKLGALGRLHPVKGHDVLIAALARLRAQGFRPHAPFEVRIAGEGAERGALEASLAAAGLDNVRLTGFEPRPQEFLADLHLFLQPSRSEGLCIAVHEAMQAGLPTLVSAVGELPYSVRDGETGLVVPPDDADALAQALSWLLSHPERLADMGAAARARVLDRFGGASFVQTGAEIMARLPVRPASDPATDPGRSRARQASGLSA
ncbi:MAG: glycosyltransferase family 4 protein [Alphaproteobacteria bacterium]|nr:glycosyltransferase family 4 protein [Alphaproteobacteria bacterium]MBU1516427.1 glycosyltransferase family 4 protein [Alphaproteobacteria bacterium]MBU2093336.1 glycosyltransferase family 4 protein [Alphaproteobacteria bacterium]MBU2153823.1 glycosyltransferase family 4 protein [Alphaproteobacteria bacterium]MBU2307695.1 glycosyltransferase family 4 protein [Alphaproteobacteria bacterium]